MDIARNTGQDNAAMIACALGGKEGGAQVERWMRLGRAARLERVETQEGLQIRFRAKPGVEEELLALVAIESNCCSWARWEVCHADDDLMLKVSSTPEGAAILHAMFSTGVVGAARPAARFVGEQASDPPGDERAARPDMRRRADGQRLPQGQGP
jgi:hypothetical protein